MTYRGSYLWRLRQTIGHDLVLACFESPTAAEVVPLESPGS